MPQGLVNNNPANDPDKKPVRSRSRFKPNVSVYQTARFGEATPFYAAETVPDDQNFSVRVNSDVDTLTLQSPLMSPLKMNKDYFFVPLRAILPHNAELLETNPLTGDDIVPENVNAVVRSTMIPGLAGLNPGDPSQASLVNSFLGSIKASFSTINEVYALLGYFLHFFRASWYFFSAGSLARNLGFNWHDYFQGPRRANGRRMNYDDVVEMFSSWILSNFKSFQVTLLDGVSMPTSDGAPTYTRKILQVVPAGYESDDNATISLRQLFFLLQQGCVLAAVSNLLFVDGVDATTLVGPLADTTGNITIGVFADRSLTTRLYEDTSNPVLPASSPKRYYNISRIVAYQLACVQFYTSDAVDYIYTPELWHENQMSLFWSGYVPTGSIGWHVVNGTRIPYDSCSCKILERISSSFGGFAVNGIIANANGWTWTIATSNAHNAACWMMFLGNLFGFNRSLKFRDYFVGSKKAPMAVGNVNVSVTAGEFTVVDVTKNILRQRFLNQVNRVGRTLKEYSRGIFGATPMPSPDECVFLGSTTDIIGAEETQNTAEGQRDPKAITSHLRGESSKFAFEGSFSEFGILIGILTFDVARPYSHNADAALLHVNRFDMFNPFMQNIGDQVVKGSEIYGQQNNQNFGYQLRYMEYRQRTDIAAGGFIYNLPGFCFLADFKNLSNPGELNVVISPDFIRSRSYEFDDIYQALPYYSPAGYYHFIIRHDCEVSADRPMLAAPSIL